MTIKSIAGVGLALILIAFAIQSADARVRHHNRISNVAGVEFDRHDPNAAGVSTYLAAGPLRSMRHARRVASSKGLPNLAEIVRRQADQIDQMRRELADIRQQLSPNVAAVPPAPPSNAIVIASASALPQDDPTFVERKPPQPQPLHVFPATAVQRGQFNDRRPSHRHAGIDLAGEYGSPIVASFAGRVLPAPGGDRGYGPHVIVVSGDDGIVYRYAHLSSVIVKIGQRVQAGERLGSMGHVGRHGRDHLHFEMIPVAEYRRRPYGVHSLDPNDYLGGGRGKRMMAGLAMTGEAARAYAERHSPNKVAGARR